MGHVYADIVLRGLKGEKPLKDILVDTGATFTVMSLQVLEEIGAIESPWTVNLLLGDKREVKARVYLGECSLNGRKGPVRIAAFKDAVPTIGVDTLETVGLTVNPVTRKLEAVRGTHALFV